MADALGPKHLLEFSRRIAGATDFQTLIAEAQAEIKERLGYSNAWLFVYEDDTLEQMRLIAIQGDKHDSVWEHAPVLRTEGDMMIEEIARTQAPVIVLDARTDPRTDKQMVARMDNRTIVNLPLRLIDRALGVLGFGTFGEEGCRAPSEPELDYVMMLASHMSVAAGRLRLSEEQRAREEERLELERRLYRIQKVESLGSLAGGIAHDFNNLLTVMINSANLLKREPLSERQRADLNVLLDAGERAGDLAGQLLSMSRQRPLRLQVVEINQQVEQLLRFVKRVLPASMELDFIAGKQLPLVNVDCSQIEQVLMNICLNARDAMPQGGRLTVESEQVVVNGNYVRAHPWARSGRYVLITVTDTGIGMTKEVIEHAFEPFFTTKPEGKGTGLGLAVAYGIMCHHEGMLHCYSEVGVGTTIKVYLPAYARPASQVGTKVEGPVPGGTERILVAEDQSIVLDLVRRVLEHAGYEVHAAVDGLAAVEAAERERYDLVILDAVMPRMSGREAYDRIRQVQPGVRFLFSSGYSGDSLPAAFLAGARADVLAKPYHTDDLLRAVRRALDAPG